MHVRFFLQNWDSEALNIEPQSYIMWIILRELWWHVTAVVV